MTRSFSTTRRTLSTLALLAASLSGALLSAATGAPPAHAATCTTLAISVQPYNGKPGGLHVHGTCFTPYTAGGSYTAIYVHDNTVGTWIFQNLQLTPDAAGAVDAIVPSNDQHIGDALTIYVNDPYRGQAKADSTMPPSGCPGILTAGPAWQTIGVSVQGSCFPAGHVVELYIHDDTRNVWAYQNLNVLTDAHGYVGRTVETDASTYNDRVTIYVNTPATGAQSVVQGTIGATIT